MTSAEFGELNDPLERLERNERQGSQAFRFVLLSTLAVLAFAVVIVLLEGGVTDDCPDDGALCLTSDRVEVVVLPLLLSIGLAITAGIKTYRRWKHRIRWRPWLYATYGMWIISTAYLLISSSTVFTRGG